MILRALIFDNKPTELPGFEPNQTVKIAHLDQNRNNSKNTFFQVFRETYFQVNILLDPK